MTSPFFGGISDDLLKNWYFHDPVRSFFDSPRELEQIARPPLLPFEHSRNIFPRFGRSVAAADKLDAGQMSDKFQVMMNVSHFKPEEVSVKVVDKYIVIHGKHEEKADEHGFIMREFTRKYLLPESVEADKLTSTVSRNGILIVQAPMKMVEPPPSNERIVPITIETHKQAPKSVQ